MFVLVQEAVEFFLNVAMSSDVEDEAELSACQGIAEGSYAW